MTDEEIAARTELRRKRVERRGKYLVMLSPAQRRIRDDYVAWVRFWRKEYKELVDQIMRNKKFIRTQGHNNVQSLKMAMRLLEKQRLRARSMLLARAAGKADYWAKTELPMKASKVA